MLAWHVGGRAYTDIDDAVQTVVSLIGECELATYKSTHDDSMIREEARADLLNMSEGDTHDFMGVQISIENISF